MSFRACIKRHHADTSFDSAHQTRLGFTSSNTMPRVTRRTATMVFVFILILSIYFLLLAAS